MFGFISDLKVCIGRITEDQEGFKPNSTDIQYRSSLHGHRDGVRSFLNVGNGWFSAFKPRVVDGTDNRILKHGGHLLPVGGKMPT